MLPTGTPPAAITPQGVRDGEPAVLAALAARRGPAVLAFAEKVCEPGYVVRAAADALARFRAEVADPDARIDVHPDSLLLRHARRAALDLAPRGPDLGCGPAVGLLLARAERTISAGDAQLLERHIASCDHCADLSASLEAADSAYRDVDEGPLDASALAPMVAALAAAAPVRMDASPPAPPEPEPDPAFEEPAPETEPDPAFEEPEPEPEPAVEEPAPEPEPEPAVEEPAPEPEPVVTDEPEPSPDEAPIGTRRVTGPPSSYYELPEPPERERGRRARRAARGAAVAGGAAASLTRRAGVAARRRLERETPEPAPVVSPPDTHSWAPVESMEFPAQPEAPEPLPYAGTPLPEPEQQESAARAAARHYRRLRHSQQKQEIVPSDGRPPRLARPVRDRGPHLPLSAHGTRDIALPAGLLVVAVLVIMAVSGVFGGGTDAPNAGRSAAAPPEVSLVTQSATSISLADAEQIAARVAGTTATP